MSTKLKAYFQEDQALLDSLCPNESAKFEAWFAELNDLNAKDDRVFYNGEPLEQGTGIKPWFDFFVDGMTPRDALNADYQDALS